jgi:hypothetical protein
MGIDICIYIYIMCTFLYTCILIMWILQPVIITVLGGVTLNPLIYRGVSNMDLLIRVHTQRI